MSPAAKTKWQELLPRLETLNITGPEHLDLLAVYCEAVATWHEATRRVQAHGHLSRVGKSVFQSPWIGIRDGAAIQMTQFATRLGFSPDAPSATRMPSFAEFADMAGSGASCAGTPAEPMRSSRPTARWWCSMTDETSRPHSGSIEDATAPMVRHRAQGFDDAADAAPATKPAPEPPVRSKRRPTSDASALGTPGTPGRIPDALGRVHGVVKYRNVRPPRRADDQPRPGGRTRFTEQQLAAALRQACGIHAEAYRALMRRYGRSVTVGTLGRLVASSPTLQAVKAQTTDLLLDYAELALLRKIEAGESKAIHFYLRFKGTSRGYVQSHKHSGDENGVLIKSETTFNFDGVPIDKMRGVYDVMTKAREAAVDTARDAARREE